MMYNVYYMSISLHMYKHKNLSSGTIPNRWQNAPLDV